MKKSPRRERGVFMGVLVHCPAPLTASIVMATAIPTHPRRAWKEESCGGEPFPNLSARPISTYPAQQARLPALEILQQEKYLVIESYMGASYWDENKIMIAPDFWPVLK
ncbi:13070_t:CDS:2 [Acaulospora colombiana]|uniref:13070_t:CDS:1 n=1 Tax=Acaulospora colombiana TaxID=27376 RepID=A0ACA9NQ21_9GLOM|nr:13070_t:CDS:2 [Acaulospora colombiana]